MVIFAFELNDLCIEKHFHLRRIERFIGSDLVGCQFRTTHKNSDLGTKTRQECCLLDRAIPTTYDGYFAPFIKWTITGCAKMHTSANVILLSWHSKTFIG